MWFGSPAAAVSLAAGQGTTTLCQLRTRVFPVGVTSWHRSPQSRAKVPGATCLFKTNPFPAGWIFNPRDIGQGDGAKGQAGSGVGGWGTFPEDIYLFSFNFPPDGRSA